jgi:hypothetical protein
VKLKRKASLPTLESSNFHCFTASSRRLSISSFRLLANLSVIMVVQDLSKDGTDSVRSFDVAAGFSFVPVDGRRGEPPLDHFQDPRHVKPQIVAKPPPSPLPKTIVNHPKDDPTLGPVLGKFVGTFRYVYLLPTLANSS